MLKRLYLARFNRRLFICSYKVWKNIVPHLWVYYTPCQGQDYYQEILGSESFARFLVSLALVLALALELEIEWYRITASVSHLTCPLPPHQSII